MAVCSDDFRTPGTPPALKPFSQQRESDLESAAIHCFAIAPSTFSKNAARGQLPARGSGRRAAEISTGGLRSIARWTGYYVNYRHQLVPSGKDRVAPMMSVPLAECRCTMSSFNHFTPSGGIVGAERYFAFLRCDHGRGGPQGGQDEGVQVLEPAPHDNEKPPFSRFVGSFSPPID